MLTITHTALNGTLIEGTARGDGTNTVLKACGWRFSRNLGGWYLPQSRDRSPKTSAINHTIASLERAGFEVTTDLDASLRNTADVEADRIQRQADRVDALTAKAHSKEANALDLTERSRELSYRMPLGQPILVDHHSAPKMTRLYKQIDTATRKSVEADKTAREAGEKAQAASATTAHRYNPEVVARRIDTLKAELRRCERNRDGYRRTLSAQAGHVDEFPPATGRYRERLVARIGEFTDQITYWEEIRAEQIKDGSASNYSRETVRKGDSVLYGRTWHQVVRVNAKSVSVATGYGWTDTVKYADIRDHRPAGDN